MLFYQLYLFTGLILAVFTFGMLWKRVRLSNQVLRLTLVCVVILIVWPGVGFVAWFDKNLTVRDYINAWLFPSSEELNSEESVNSSDTRSEI